MMASFSSNLSLEIGELKRRVEEAMDITKRNIETAPKKERLEGVIADLEQETSQPGFWDNPNASRTKQVNNQLAQSNRMYDRLKRWDELKGDCDAALALIEELDDEEEVSMIIEECTNSASLLLEDGRRYELESLLSGEYDNRPARIIITAGAGGTEACDWVEMLLRMYTRHAQQMDYTVQMEDSTAGDVVGYKSVEFIVQGGDNAYGWFRGEKGAHRLVRLSPFNANNKRQTTFAGVDVIPVLDEDEVKEVEVPDSELEISTMRSGGKGGQNVNKVESGVRIQHIPTGINIKCTQERSQHLNKELAMNRLKAQLLAIAQEQKCQELNAIRGDIIEAAWGAQIRNYVLQPYKMIKDQRNNWETSDAQGFLDGNLEDCISDLLRFRAKQEQIAQEEQQIEI